MPKIALTAPQAKPLRLAAGRDLSAVLTNLGRIEVALRDLQQQLNEAYHVLSQATDELLVSGTLALRPPAGVTNRIFVATDQAAGANAFFDTGTAWQLM